MSHSQPYDEQHPNVTPVDTHNASTPKLSEVQQEQHHGRGAGQFTQLDEQVVASGEIILRLRVVQRVDQGTKPKSF